MSTQYHGLLVKIDNRKGANNIAALRRVAALVELDDELEPPEQVRFVRDKLELIDRLSSGEDALLIDPPEPPSKALVVLDSGMGEGVLETSITNPIQAFDGVCLEHRIGLADKPVMKGGLDMKSSALNFIVQR